MMPKIVILLVISIVIFAGTLEAARRTGSYTTKQGTYVMPYYSSSPNRAKWDNWSSAGNVNPYTGKRGYRKWY